MMRFLKPLLQSVVVLLVLVLLLAVWKWMAPRGAEPAAPVAGVPADLPASISHGQYLATAADCVACHTRDGGTPFAGGRPFKLPFGILYATNLTPDAETGIGSWSDQAFVDAVRRGSGSHGPLYPAMPYTSYAGLSRADVLDIKHYLESLAPVKQVPPANTLGFPFNIRQGMYLWNLAFFREQRFAPKAEQSVVWNRGAYLAGPLGHCGECHTPRNIGFAMKSRDYMAGTVVQGWKAYNTTSDTGYGLGGWSRRQLTDFLSEGHAQGRSSAVGPMGEVVEHSLQYLTPGDIQALVVYLQSISPQRGHDDATVNLDPVAVRDSSAVLPDGPAPDGHARGAHLFESDCAGCHQWNGEGRETVFASLVGSHAANDPQGMAIVQVILKGSRLNVHGQAVAMPPFAAVYSDADVAALANYVLAHFGQKQGTVNADQVRALRAQP